MKSTSILFRAAVVGALFFAPLGAFAQNPQSESFFAEGRKLRLAGKCAEAIVAFRRSFELSPERIGSLRNIAECERELGKYASSRRSYWDLRRAAMKSDDPNYQGWDKDAEKAYDEMTPKVSHLTVKLEGRTQGVIVAVDGLTLDPRLIGVEVEQDLGAHSVEARYGGVVPIVEKVALAEGEHKTITLRIPTEAAAAGGGRSALFFSGIAAASVGGAALVAMGISAGIRAGALQTIESSCPTLKDCSPSLAGEIDKGRTATTLANVFGGVAAVGVAGGGALLLTSRFAFGSQPAAKPAASLRVYVSPLPDSAAVRLEGTF